MSLSESIVEDAAIEWVRPRASLGKASVSKQGYAGQVGDPPPSILHQCFSWQAKLRRAKTLLAPGEPAAERDSFDGLVLVVHLREAILRPNSAIPEESLATVRPLRIVQNERRLII